MTQKLQPRHFSDPSSHISYKIKVCTEFMHSFGDFELKQVTIELSVTHTTFDKFPRYY